MAADIVPIRREKPVSNKFDPNAISEHEYAHVPSKDSHYVPFGEFKMIEKIVASGKFFPVFISGHSGNGKTFMVEQVCAKTKRPMIRVQMSRETDEDDLIGGFRLIQGETKFLKGPVLQAMELGALLLIDEADRADPGKAMCLQGILEGKPYFMKKTGEIVYPAPGFNVIVTANTKGRGSDDGRYVAATMLDDAWLERFPITIEQEYPALKVEKKILTNYLNDGTMTNDDESFIDHLTVWSEIIRKTFSEGAIDELISTRRLVHIAHTYRMIGDRMKAIRLCINRFDEETKTAFLDLYTKVDPTINPVAESPATDPTDGAEKTQEVAF
jgi:MoxR-like ATPase